MSSTEQDLVALMSEAYRVGLLRAFEKQIGLSGYRFIAGVDEAGRGCLAGPVVAAAVIVDPDSWIPGVDDSKKLKPAQRERLCAIIEEQCIASAWVAVSASVIDRINILEATRCAMRRSVEALRPTPDLVLVDAVRIETTAPSVPVVKGDALSYAIACASIVAKVHRDRIMTELDEQYPDYGFGSHKGYAAGAHRRALEVLGPTPAHRLTFQSVIPRLESAQRGA